MPVPPTSTDINPVENVFNNVRNKLRTDGWEQEIKYEPYEILCERVSSTLLNLTTEIINLTIESMLKRMNLILAGTPKSIDLY